MMQPERVLVCDANVLIDFIEVDAEILRLAAVHLGTVVVLTTTLEKVNPLSEKACRELGLEVREPSTEDLITVGATPIAGLAFDDRVMAHIVLRDGYTCVTNDVKARNYLKSEGASPLWGLDLLLELVRTRAVTMKRARSVVKALVTASPKHYSPNVVQLFEERLSAISKSP